MIYELITWLICAVTIVAFIQPNAPRFFAATAFIGITLLHETLLSSYDGLTYYGTAALFDLAIIILTSGINPIPRMVITLHKICIVSILANWIGWGLWVSYYPPLAYDVLFAVIYVWALVTFLKRGGIDDVGGYTMDSWNTCFRFNSYTRRGYFNKYGGKV